MLGLKSNRVSNRGPVKQNHYETISPILLGRISYKYITNSKHGQSVKKYDNLPYQRPEKIGSIL